MREGIREATLVEAGIGHHVAAGLERDGDLAGVAARADGVVRGLAREPMKDYLRSAAALIKQYAWAFPAFKKPVGVTNPMQIDLQTLTEISAEKNSTIIFPVPVDFLSTILMKDVKKE